jgi:glycosyltransferase involved in cell wall biosynthesis
MATSKSLLLSVEVRCLFATPAFSVIITCYSQRNLIGNAINSVIEQSWPQWEIIVVDNGSEDKVSVNKFLRL